jgi:hypothetical protein
MKVITKAHTVSSTTTAMSPYPASSSAALAVDERAMEATVYMLGTSARSCAR